ncbi:MAG: endonuclease I, partial [Verrucomicrobiae bacterium]|nr:endonuclease I [Verrucomicrobiae bacterium]
LAFIAASDASLIITGVFDGPLSGGTPKIVELYSTSDLGDMTGYTVEFYFNANTTPSFTTTLSGSITTGEYIYLTPNSAEFTTYFGGSSDFSGGSINGDDSVVLKQGATTIDVFGSPGTDGTGLVWDYLDGWAYRKSWTFASPTFDAGDWIFSGINATDNDTSNATSSSPFPIGSYVPEPAAALLGSFGLIGLLRRRRA